MIMYFYYYIFLSIHVKIDIAYILSVSLTFEVVFLLFVIYFCIDFSLKFNISFYIKRQLFFIKIWLVSIYNYLYPSLRYMLYHAPKLIILNYNCNDILKKSRKPNYYCLLLNFKKSFRFFI